MMIPLSNIFARMISATGKLIHENAELIIPARNGAVVNNSQPMINDILAGSYGLRSQIPLPLTINMTPKMEPPGR